VAAPPVHAPAGYECPFCTIVGGGENPPWTFRSDVVFRGDTTTAWINRRWWKNNAGNVVVVPNVHVENMYGLARELAGEVHETARRIALAMKAAYGCGGVSTRQHNEPAGDQEVWHYHLHVFPRYEGDDLYRSPHRLTTAAERRSYAERLVEALG
jgi:histidine triad (HIT) family protein